MTEPLTLTCGDVARALGYLHTRGDIEGQPNRRLVRKLVEERKIPPPIDDSLAYAYWRWSRAEIEAYAVGQWKPQRNGVAS